MSGSNDYINKFTPLWSTWEVEKLIGGGSFGKVYKIYREDFGSNKYEAALKLIHIPQSENEINETKNLCADEESLKAYFKDHVNSLVKEIELMYKVKGNSNIVNYEDHMIVENEEGIGWDILIRMELLDPLSVYAKNSNMSCNPKDVIRMGMEICSGLEVCAKENIIHRDIKDENIFVNKNGTFKLGDFGIAKELSKSGMAETKIGTEMYAAPEIYLRKSYDKRVDIFSLGIVLYKMLNNGRFPFMPPHPQQIMARHKQEAIDKRIKGESVPLPAEAENELGEVIAKAIHSNPEKRYSSPKEFRMALKHVLDTMDFSYADNEPLVHSDENDSVSDTDETARLDYNADDIVDDRTERISYNEANQNTDKTERLDDSICDLAPMSDLITSPDQQNDNQDKNDQPVKDNQVKSNNKKDTQKSQKKKNKKQKKSEEKEEKTPVQSTPNKLDQDSKKKSLFKPLVAGIALAAVAGGVYFMSGSEPEYSEVYTWNNEIPFMSIESTEQIASFDKNAIIHTEITQEDFETNEYIINGMPVSLMGHNQAGNMKVYGIEKFIVYSESPSTELINLSSPESIKALNEITVIKKCTEDEFFSVQKTYESLVLTDGIENQSGNMMIYQIAPMSVVYTSTDINTLLEVKSIEDVLNNDPDAIVISNLTMAEYGSNVISEEHEVTKGPVVAKNTNIKLYQLKVKEETVQDNSTEVVEEVKEEVKEETTTEVKKTVTKTKPKTQTTTVDTTLDLN